MGISVGIAGASGYAGAELLRLLARHPVFEVRVATANQQAGQPIRKVHPQLATLGDAVFTSTDPTVLGECELVFLALPHGASAAVVRELPTGCRVVDLGADFRLQSAESWQNYYGAGVPHAGTWQYGLPELVDHQMIAASTRVANPGCYATGIALAAAPLVQRKLVAADDLVVVAASGTSGAGRTPTESLLASEVMGSISSYKTGGVHQHTPEIEQTLSALTDESVRLSFTPLLAPMPRGIHVTLTARLRDAVDLNQLFADYYGSQPFITVLPEPEQPRTASVLGSNQVQVQALIDHHANRAVVTLVLDNLVKGAAGQAIQNANLMYGLSQTAALDQIGVAP